tara:strand:+ start:72 stop:263 length:192 start_codon:yes stop_codon:yes gene_type:complete
LACELFENLSCDVLVVKVAYEERKNRLGSNSKCSNWAIAWKQPSTPKKHVVVGDDFLLVLFAN